jgi:AcrR family transcriptional regulator
MPSGQEHGVLHMSLENKVSRERILQGADAILDSGHYTDLTVDALARSLRMSKSTLYKYFPSKEDVVVALVRDACDRADTDLANATSASTASEQLTAMLKSLGQLGQRLPRAVIVETERLPAACANRLAQVRASFAEAAIAIVEKGHRSNEFKFADPRVAAVGFVAAAEAVLADGARRQLADYGPRIETLIDLFLPGLRGTSRKG